jgi:hypothetical protein
MVKMLLYVLVLVHILYEIYRASFKPLYRVHLATGRTSVLIGTGCICSLDPTNTLRSRPRWPPKIT